MIKLFDPIGIVHRFVFLPCLQLNFLGAIVGIASLAQGRKAGKRADAAGAQRLGLEKEKLDFAKSQYEDYKEKFGGLETDLLTSIDEFADRKTLGRYTGQGVADVRSAYEKAEEMGDRQLTRYGLDPNDPRFLQQKRETGLEEAKSEILARNQAQEKFEAEQDKLFAKRIAVGQFGKGSPQQAGAVTSAIGSTARAYGREAEGYAKQAGAGYGLGGKLLSGAYDKYTGGGSSDGYSDAGGGYDEPVWEGSNYVTDADVGELGW